MKKRRQTEVFPARLLPLFTLLLFLFSCSSLPLYSRPGDTTEHLTILYLNDLHGQLEPFRSEEEKMVGGAARLATLIDQIRAENSRLGRHTLFLVAGDLFLGTPMSAIFKGEAEVKFLNQTQADVLTLGPHEFDFGREILQERIQQANFAVISANVYKGRERLFPPVVAKNLPGGLRVAILGLITPDSARVVNPSTVPDLIFTDPVAEAKALVPEIKRSSDLLIALTHTGLELDKRLAQEAPGLDLIIGGHDHIALAEPLKVGEVWIGQAKNRGQFLGRIDLRFEGKKVVKAAGTLIPITEELAENREVKALVSSYRTKLGQKLREVVGNTRARLDGEAEKIRRMETNLGNLVADIMRQAATTEIALVNGGTIRGSIEVGPITLEDVWRVFPYDSQLVRLELSGSQIEEVLNHSVSLGPSLTGGFLQVSGLSFVIGRSGPEDIRVHGEPLRKDRFYSVAITDFMLAGGDGYGHFKKGRSRLEHPFLIRDLFLDYLKENKEISPHLEGRIRRQP